MGKWGEALDVESTAEIECVRAGLLGVSVTACKE